MGKGIVSERRPRGCRPSVDNVGAGGTNKTGLSGKPPDCGCAHFQFSVCHKLVQRQCARDPAYGAEQSGRGKCPRRRLVWRIQSSWPTGPNMAQVERPVTAHDGYHNPSWQDLYVFYRGATLPVWLWFELYS